MKRKNTTQVRLIAIIVALGGLLMGFDASVISGVVKFIEVDFNLSKLQLGWVVASLTLTATFAMMVAGPLSDRFGRRSVLRVASVLYFISALASAMAPDYPTLVLARMLGGFGVGASLILAPMYIAEISPKELRGRLVSFNQLNIVIGISLAFFSNYFILLYSSGSSELVQSWNLEENSWRLMLGIEAIPAVIYFLALFLVPRSPRWLLLKGKDLEAIKVMTRVIGNEKGREEITRIKESLHQPEEESKAGVKDLFKSSMRLVLTIGVVLAILQQITGINSVFFYAPMIFEESGLGTDASFMQAILVGIINLVFTILAILFIDRFGRRPLLIGGVAGIAVSMLVLAGTFYNTTYQLKETDVPSMPGSPDHEILKPHIGEIFSSEKAFTTAMQAAYGNEFSEEVKSNLQQMAVKRNNLIILLAILAFVASFAISIGPVMWVLFSELFPNQLRGLAISFVGLINSAISFLVQWIFPWELEVLGSAATFFIYGVFATLGLWFVIKKVPETKGKSLEELEAILIKK